MGVDAVVVAQKAKTYLYIDRVKNLRVYDIVDPLFERLAKFVDARTAERERHVRHGAYRWALLV
jgi:hypothetical protein